MTFNPLNFLSSGKNMDADERRREEEIKRRKDAQAMAEVLEEQSERDRRRRDMEQREEKFHENSNNSIFSNNDNNSESKQQKIINIEKAKAIIESLKSSIELQNIDFEIAYNNAVSLLQNKKLLISPIKPGAQLSYLIFLLLTPCVLRTDLFKGIQKTLKKGEPIVVTLSTTRNDAFSGRFLPIDINKYISTFDINIDFSKTTIYTFESEILELISKITSELGLPELLMPLKIKGYSFEITQEDPFTDNNCIKVNLHINDFEDILLKTKLFELERLFSSNDNVKALIQKEKTNEYCEKLFENQDKKKKQEEEETLKIINQKNITKKLKIDNEIKIAEEIMILLDSCENLINENKFKDILDNITIIERKKENITSDKYRNLTMKIIDLQSLVFNKIHNYVNFLTEKNRFEEAYTQLQLINEYNMGYPDIYLLIQIAKNYIKKPNLKEKGYNILDGIVKDLSSNRERDIKIYDELTEILCKFYYKEASKLCGEERIVEYEKIDNKYLRSVYPKKFRDEVANYYLKKAMNTKDLKIKKSILENLANNSFYKFHNAGKKAKVLLNRLY